MRTRVIAVMAALMLMIAAFPFGASAAAPNTARLSATSYLDTAGNESDALCDIEATTFIEALVSYSGTGPELGGTGTGELGIEVFGSSFFFSGELEIDGEPAFIEGGGSLNCLNPGYALVTGGFFISGGEVLPPPPGPPAALLEPGDEVCGDLAGYIQDGVHRNQGRVSLTLSGSDTECLVT